MFDGNLLVIDGCWIHVRGKRPTKKPIVILKEGGVEQKCESLVVTSCMNLLCLSCSHRGYKYVDNYGDHARNS